MDQPPHGESNRSAGEARRAADRGNGEATTESPFQAAMPQQMKIDGALGDGEAQTRGQLVFHLFPHVCSIEFIFHVGLFLCSGRSSDRSWCSAGIWRQQCFDS